MTEFKEYHKYMYDTFIRRIEHEHMLMNNRLSSFFSAQAFLFAAFVLGHDKEDIQWLINYVIPILGLMLSILIIISIISTRDALEFWRKKVSDFLSNNDNFSDFNVSNHKKIYWLGMTFQYWTPMIFLLVWVIIIVVAGIKGVCSGYV